METAHDKWLQKECSRLWKEAFGDSDDFIGSFMELHYREEGMLYIEENGKLLSMLHIIPFEACGMRVAYIYAVATAIQARGKGYAARLIHEAITKTAAEGFQAVVILPASESLMEYYSRFGFHDRHHVVFDTPDGFDFGTGESSNDFVTILPTGNASLPFLENEEIILRM